MVELLEHKGRMLLTGSMVCKIKYSSQYTNYVMWCSFWIVFSIIIIINIYYLIYQ